MSHLQLFHGLFKLMYKMTIYLLITFETTICIFSISAKSNNMNKTVSDENCQLIITKSVTLQKT
jgi:hypothetical protein